MIKEIEIIAGEGMRNFGFYSAFMSLEQGGEHRYGAIPAVSSEWTAYRQAQVLRNMSNSDPHGN